MCVRACVAKMSVTTCVLACASGLLTSAGQAELSEHLSSSYHVHSTTAFCQPNGCSKLTSMPEVRHVACGLGRLGPNDDKVVIEQ